MDEKILSVRDGGWFQVNSPQYTTGLMHIQTNRDCDSTQKTCRGSDQTKIPELKRGNGHKAPPLMKNIRATDTCYERENTFLPME